MEQNHSKSELLTPSDNELQNTVPSGYKSDVDSLFKSIPETAKPLLRKASIVKSIIEKALYTAPAFINVVRAAHPEFALQAVLTDAQKEQIAAGALKLMTKKDGTLLASLVNPGTNRIVASVPLESVQLTPELTQAMTSFSTQMQLAQIAEDIKAMQIAIEGIRQGLEYDRLATAYSCQQMFLQAMQLKKPELKTNALMQLIASAEHSRNLLMLSQKSTVSFLMNEPESNLKKLFSKTKSETIDIRINELRSSLDAVNIVSFAEAMAYNELGEYDAARASLEYYSEFLSDTYLNEKSLVKRLDLMDPAPENYWSKKLPSIRRRIKALPVVEDAALLLSEGSPNEE